MYFLKKFQKYFKNRNFYLFLAIFFCNLEKSLLFRKNRANIAETARGANELKKYIMSLFFIWSWDFLLSSVRLFKCHYVPHLGWEVR